MPTLLNTESQLETQMELIGNNIAHPISSIALIKDDSTIANIIPLTPPAVAQLVERKIEVLVQRGYSAHTDYTDLDYANVGAEIVDDLPTLFSRAAILLKLSAFNMNEAQLMQKKQIIISNLNLQKISNEYIEIVQQNKMTAIGLNFIKNRNDKPHLEEILSNTIDHHASSIALSSFILPILSALVFNHNIRNAIQTTPALMQGVYCYKGILCNKEIATQLQIMWKDILSLCWDLN